MQFFVLALSLPRKGHFFTLHKHESRSALTWTPKDRDAYLNFVQGIEMLYQNDAPTNEKLNLRELHLMYVEGLDSTQAVNRVLPYFLTCNSSNRKRINTPNVTDNDVEIISLAGTADTLAGLRYCVIAKGAANLNLLPWVYEEVSARRGSEFTSEEAATLEGRSDPILVQVISQADRPVTSEGFAKIVTPPADANVRLTRNHRGEFISEIARSWY